MHCIAAPLLQSLTTQTPFRTRDNWVPSFWQESQLPTGSGSTGQFSTSQQPCSTQTTLEDRTYRFAIKVDGNPSTAYYLYCGNYSPATCLRATPYVSSNGRAIGYRQ